MSEDIIEPQEIQNEAKQSQNTGADAERSEYFVKDLDQKLSDENVKIAFLFVIDPKSEQPIMYSKGTTYQLTRVTVDMAKYFKARLNQELEV